MRTTINLPEQVKKPRRPPYKKPDSIRELEALEMEAARAKYPGIKPSYIAPRRHRDDNANALTKAVVRYIELKGGFATRLSSEGSWRPRLQKWVPSQQKRGLPDIYALYKSITLFIEIKIGSDRLGPNQERIKDKVESSGGLFFIARNFTEFKTWFDSLDA